MECAIGIDSGGSHYRIKLVDREGNVLSYRVDDPIMHSHFAADELRSAVSSSISQALHDSQVPLCDVKAAVCGIAGLDSADDKAAIYEVYRSILPPDCYLEVMNDAEIALLSSAGPAGMVVASGTGSIAYGRTLDGREARVGGWPFLMHGDEGSGSWMARNALRMLGRYFDGVEECTVLIRLLIDELGLPDRKALLRFAHSECTRSANLSSIGPVINQAAEEGDSLAISLLRSAASELSGLVQDLDHVLGFSVSGKPFQVGVWGSVLRGSALLFDMFSSSVSALFPQAVICKPQKEAIDCAVERAVSNI